MDETQQELLVSVAEQVKARYFGKYRGRVAEVGDSDKLGLIRANVQEIYHDQVSPWARPAAPFAGNNHGLLAIPEKGDGVWVEFEAGDISKPIWSGFWWGKNEIPKPGGVETRVFATSKGHKLVLDDENSEVVLEHGGGPKITIKDSEISLEVGQKKIVISSSRVAINGSALKVS